MASFNYFFCILGILFCQVCLVYSYCKEINDLTGVISHTYSISGDRLHYKCWTLENPYEDEIFIQLNNITLHNRSASAGVLTIKLLAESKEFNVSSQSQLRNFTTTSYVVQFHFLVNGASFALGMETGFSLYFNIDCNRTLTEFNGSIYSPNYEGHRGINKAECSYEIRLRPGYLVNITFDFVKIGTTYDADCEIDYLQIRDGDTEESPLIANICERMESYSVQSTSNHLWMKLKAGHYLNDGFKGNYRAIAIDQMVEKSTNMVDPKEEVITDSSNQTMQTSSAVDKLESTTMAHELPPCANETTHLTIKDVMDMEVKEHRRRLEVIELQKRYEMARIEFQKQIEIERLKQRNNTITLKFEDLQEDAIRIVFGNRSAKAIVIHN